MQKLLYLCLSTCLFILACDRTEAPVGFNSPVFSVAYATDTIAGDSVVAGKNGIYLFTRYELNDGKYRSINSFSDAGCPDGSCPGSLTFEFQHNVGVDSAFSGGFYRYTLPDSLLDTTSTYNGTFQWGDIFSNFQKHTLTVGGSNPGVYPPPLTGTTQSMLDVPTEISLNSVNDSNDMFSILDRKVRPGNLEAYPSVSIKIEPVGGGLVLTAFNDWAGPAITSYLWNNGETSNIIQFDSLVFQDVYSVTVTDVNDNTAAALIGNISYPLQNEIRSPQISFDAVKTGVLSQYPSVAIQWVDANGVIWRSDRGPQDPGIVSFQILSAEDYEPNENGDAVRKLRVRFRSFLYQTNGYVTGIMGEGFIAMARP
jgi:hypothetical protein